MIKRVLCFGNPARLSLKLAQMVVELQDVTRTLQSINNFCPHTPRSYRVVNVIQKK